MVSLGTLILVQVCVLESLVRIPSALKTRFHCLSPNTTSKVYAATFACLQYLLFADLVYDLKGAFENFKARTKVRGLRSRTMV